MSDDEAVHNLIRQMYEAAEAAPWELSAEDIRTQRRRRSFSYSIPRPLWLWPLLLH